VLILFQIHSQIIIYSPPISPAHQDVTVIVRTTIYDGIRVRVTGTYGGYCSSNGA